MEQQVEALKQNAELRAFNTVVELIRQREIVPGQRLFEPDLSKRLSMSRAQPAGCGRHSGQGAGP